MTFKHFGIGVKWVTETTPEAFAAAIDEKTKAIFIESIANPKYQVYDISAVAKVVKSCFSGCTAVTDCFCLVFRLLMTMESHL